MVVAPTVTAMGLAFFSYGFPLAGSCVEISIPQIALLFLFAMVWYARQTSNCQPKIAENSFLGYQYSFFLLARAFSKICLNTNTEYVEWESLWVGEWNTFCM